MLIVVDTETTGLQAGHHEVIQVAAMALDLDTMAEVARFQSHARPLHPERASARALEVNGTTPEQMAAYPDPGQVARDFAAWVSQHGGKHPIPVGYNLPFDIGHLQAFAPAVRWSYRQIDVMQLAIALIWLPGWITDCKLTTVTAKLRIPHNAHDAMGDVEATAEVLRRITRAWSRNVLAIKPKEAAHAP